MPAQRWTCRLLLDIIAPSLLPLLSACFTPFCAPLVHPAQHARLQRQPSPRFCRRRRPSGFQSIAAPASTPPFLGSARFLGSKNRGRKRRRAPCPTPPPLIPHGTPFRRHPLLTALELTACRRFATTHFLCLFAAAAPALMSMWTACGCAPDCANLVLDGVCGDHLVYGHGPWSPMHMWFLLALRGPGCIYPHPGACNDLPTCGEVGQPGAGLAHHAQG